MPTGKLRALLTEFLKRDKEKQIEAIRKAEKIEDITELLSSSSFDNGLIDLAIAKGKEIIQKIDDPRILWEDSFFAHTARFSSLQNHSASRIHQLVYSVTLQKAPKWFIDLLQDFMQNPRSIPDIYMPILRQRAEEILKTSAVAPDEGKRTYER